MRATLAILVVAVSAGTAAGGSIPIDEPTVITQPGSYRLITDLKGSVGSVPNIIKIQASDVVLDLGGHTLTCSLGVHCLRIGFDDPGNPLHDVTVMNGTFLGGGYPILSLETDGIRLLRLAFEADIAVQLYDPGGLEIDSCDFFSAQITPVEVYRSLPGDNTGRIANSTFTGTYQSPAALYLESFSNGEIVDNEFVGGTLGGIAIRISGGAGHNLIAGNTVTAAGSLVSYWNGLSLSSSHNTVINNRFGSQIKGYHAVILVYGDDNLIQANDIEDCGGPSNRCSGVSIIGNVNVVRDNDIHSNTGNGIVVLSGVGNLIENNRLTGNGLCGLRLPPDGSNYDINNYFSDNAAGDVCFLGPPQ